MSDFLHTVVLVIHVIGAAIIIGSSFVSVIVFIGKGSIPLDNVKLLNRLWKIVGPILGIQLLSGLYLGISEWSEIGKSPLFWLKLILFIVTGVVGRALLGKRLEELQKKGMSTTGQTGIKKWTWIVLSLFVLIAILGVILAESHP